MKEKTISKNRKARFNYEITETYEAGISLLGSEVKSLRGGKANLGESYIKEKNGEIFIQGMNISPYEFANKENHDPLRIRKLLLNKQEIKKISTKTKESGFTIVPLEIFFNERGKVKLKIALAKGKKLYDKRETIKAREDKIDVARSLKKGKY